MLSMSCWPCRAKAVGKAGSCSCPVLCGARARGWAPSASPRAAAERGPRLQALLQVVLAGSACPSHRCEVGFLRWSREEAGHHLPPVSTVHPISKPTPIPNPAPIPKPRSR